VTPAPFEFPAPAADEFVGEDWFGEGSVFDTGEDLATALAALASGEMVWPVDALDLSGVAVPSPTPAGGPVTHERTLERPAPPVAPPRPPDEFQVATMPSSRGVPPAGWALHAPRSISRPRQLGAGAAPERSGWSIRQSVQMLRMTENALYQLREEAAQLSWQLAALAYRDIDA